MRRAAGFGDRFVAKSKKFGVEKNGIDLPKALPGDGHISLSGETLTCLSCVPQHPGKSLAVEVALIKGDAAFLDDTRHKAGSGDAGANGADACVTLRYAVNFRAHLRGGEKGVAALIHRGAARVSGLSPEGDRVAFNAVGAKHGSERQIGIEKDGPLFNMELEVGGGVRGVLCRFL